MININFLEEHIWLSHLLQIIYFLPAVAIQLPSVKKKSFINESTPSYIAFIFISAFLIVFQILPVYLLILHITCGVAIPIYLAYVLQNEKKIHFFYTILEMTKLAWTSFISCYIFYVYFNDFFELALSLVILSWVADFLIYFRSFTFMSNAIHFSEFLKFSRINNKTIFYNINFLIFLLFPQPWIMILLIGIHLVGLHVLNNSHPLFFLASSKKISDVWESRKFDVALLVVGISLLAVSGYNQLSYHVLAFTYFFLATFTLRGSTVYLNRTEHYLGMTSFLGSEKIFTQYFNSNFFKAKIQKTARPKVSGSNRYGYFRGALDYINEDGSDVLGHNETLLVTGIKKSNVISQDQLLSKSQHFVIMINDYSSLSEIYCYKKFHEFSGRVDSVIDLFYYVKDSIKTTEIMEKEEELYKTRLMKLLELKCNIGDEKIPLIFSDSDLFKSLDMSAVNLNMDLSEYIGLPLNEDWSENEDYYPLMQKQLHNNGFYEMNTLLRQMREGASVPSRFMDAIGISEAYVRMLVGLLITEMAHSQYESTIEYRNQELQVVSFGKCMQILRKGISEDKPIAQQVKTVVNSKYKDEENMKRLKQFITKLGFKGSVKQSPSLMDILDYMVFIRNKTRGHGTPSKVDFEFYVALDLISVFIVHSLLPLSVKIFSKLEFLNKPIYLNYNCGGVIVADTEVIEKKQWENTFDYNQRSIFTNVKDQFTNLNKDLLLSLETENERFYMDMSIYFKQKDGKLHYWDGLTRKGEEQWISFTTGGIIRPGYLDEIQ